LVVFAFFRFLVWSESLSFYDFLGLWTFHNSLINPFSRVSPIDYRQKNKPTQRNAFFPFLLFLVRFWVVRDHRASLFLATDSGELVLPCARVFDTPHLSSPHINTPHLTSPHLSSPLLSSLSSPLLSSPLVWRGVAWRGVAWR
jgi:hypothetical protein